MVLVSNVFVFAILASYIHCFDVNGPNFGENHQPFLESQKPNENEIVGFGRFLKPLQRVKTRAKIAARKARVRLHHPLLLKATPQDLTEEPILGSVHQNPPLQFVEQPLELPHITVYPGEGETLEVIPTSYTLSDLPSARQSDASSDDTPEPRHFHFHHNWHHKPLIPNIFGKHKDFGHSYHTIQNQEKPVSPQITINQNFQISQIAGDGNAASQSQSSQHKNTISSHKNSFTVTPNFQESQVSGHSHKNSFTVSPNFQESQVNGNGNSVSQSQSSSNNQDDSFFKRRNIFDLDYLRKNNRNVIPESRPRVFKRSIVNCDLAREDFYAHPKRTKRFAKFLRLALDPKARVDLPGSIGNVESLARNSMDNRRSLGYHLRRAVGSAKDAVISGMHIVPQHLVIPSDYQIVHKNDHSVVVQQSRNRANFEKNPFMDMVQKSIRSGQRTLDHMGDAYNSARRAMLTAHVSKLPHVVSKTLRLPQLRRVSSKSKREYGDLSKTVEVLENAKVATGSKSFQEFIGRMHREIDQHKETEKRMSEERRRDNAARHAQQIKQADREGTLGILESLDPTGVFYTGSDGQLRSASHPEPETGNVLPLSPELLKPFMGRSSAMQRQSTFEENENEQKSGRINIPKYNEITEAKFDNLNTPMERTSNFLEEVTTSNVLNEINFVTTFNENVQPFTYLKTEPSSLQSRSFENPTNEMQNLNKNAKKNNYFRFVKMRENIQPVMEVTAAPLTFRAQSDNSFSEINENLQIDPTTYTPISTIKTTSHVSPINRHFMHEDVVSPESSTSSSLTTNNAEIVGQSNKALKNFLCNNQCNSTTSERPTVDGVTSTEKTTQEGCADFPGSTRSADGQRPLRHPRHSSICVCRLKPTELTSKYDIDNKLNCSCEISFRTEDNPKTYDCNFVGEKTEDNLLTYNTTCRDNSTTLRMNEVLSGICYCKTLKPIYLLDSKHEVEEMQCFCLNLDELRTLQIFKIFNNDLKNYTINITDSSESPEIVGQQNKVLQQFLCSQNNCSTAQNSTTTGEVSTEPGTSSQTVVKQKGCNNETGSARSSCPDDGKSSRIDVERSRDLTDSEIVGQTNTALQQFLCSQNNCSTAQNSTTTTGEVSTGPGTSSQTDVKQKGCNNETGSARSSCSDDGKFSGIDVERSRGLTDSEVVGQTNKALQEFLCSTNCSTAENSTTEKYDGKSSPIDKRSRDLTDSEIVGQTNKALQEFLCTKNCSTAENSTTTEKYDGKSSPIDERSRDLTDSEIVGQTNKALQEFLCTKNCSTAENSTTTEKYDGKSSPIDERSRDLTESEIVGQANKALQEFLCSTNCSTAENSTTTEKYDGKSSTIDERSRDLTDSEIVGQTNTALQQFLCSQNNCSTAQNSTTTGEVSTEPGTSSQTVVKQKGCNNETGSARSSCSDDGKSSRIDVESSRGLTDTEIVGQTNTALQQFLCSQNNCSTAQNSTTGEVSTGPGTSSQTVIKQEGCNNETGSARTSCSNDGKSSRIDVERSRGLTDSEIVGQTNKALQEFLSTKNSTVKDGLATQTTEKVGNCSDISGSATTDSCTNNKNVTNCRCTNMYSASKAMYCKCKTVSLPDEDKVLLHQSCTFVRIGSSPGKINYNGTCVDDTLLVARSNVDLNQHDSTHQGICKCNITVPNSDSTESSTLIDCECKDLDNSKHLRIQQDQHFGEISRNSIGLALPIQLTTTETPEMDCSNSHILDLTIHKGKFGADNFRGCIPSSTTEIPSTDSIKQAIKKIIETNPGKFGVSEESSKSSAFKDDSNRYVTNCECMPVFVSSNNTTDAHCDCKTVTVIEEEVIRQRCSFFPRKDARYKFDLICTKYYAGTSHENSKILSDIKHEICECTHDVTGSSSDVVNCQCKTPNGLRMLKVYLVKKLERLGEPERERKLSEVSSNSDTRNMLCQCWPKYEVLGEIQDPRDPRLFCSCKKLKDAFKSPIIPYSSNKMRISMNLKDKLLEPYLGKLERVEFDPVQSQNYDSSERKK